MIWLIIIPVGALRAGGLFSDRRDPRPSALGG
jgi:hypothetical protein